MVAACVFHLTKGGVYLIGVNIFFAVMAGMVALGRRSWLTGRRSFASASNSYPSKR
jgi:hypothetical protein